MLSRRVLARQSQWLQGDFLNEGQFATAILNARAIGEAAQAQDIADLDYSTLVTELENDD